LRDLQIGEDVLASNGERLGKIDRIVVDEAGDRVTHLVVDDRVVELARFREAGADGLALDATPEEFQQFPTLEDSPFSAPAEHWQPPPGFVMRNFLAFAALVGQAPYQPPVQADVPREERAHEITAGSHVWSGDDKIGEVDHVITDDSGNTVRFVLTRAAQHYLVPIANVIEVIGNNVRVDLSESEVEQLERYTPPPRRTA
jgi:hypothetical protein